MLVPYSWLRDFAPFDLDPTVLAETLDDLGMVVEGVERVGQGMDGVVVARVLDVRPHPSADRVRLADVDAGDGRTLQVVCGAPNVATGQLVPLATVGTVLPGGMEIARRQVRGQWSDGMLCSAVELELGDDGEGILVLPDGLEPGASLTEALGLADVVFDLAIEPNRPDALSVAGVARDAAARLGLPFALPEPVVVEGATPVGRLATVAVRSPELCPRFTARVVTGVEVGPSPAGIVRRLALAGMRSINNVVDASNYVMLELGQPTHPYDLDRLPGRGLLVRRAEPGEVVVTLDGVPRAMGDGDDCLICDATGEPVGIGGVMGGASSEISPGTTTVLLEAAYFTPMAVARTAKRTGLRTEASARFERGCDPAGIERSVGRFLQLLGTGEVAAGMLDVSSLPPPPPPIRVRTARVNALLGTDLSDDRVRTYLAPIGFAATPAGEGLSDVVPPTFRPDATTEIDVVEEVARHHGYGAIPRTRPSSPQVGHLTSYQRGRRRLREVLAGAGVSEAVTGPLVAPGDHERAGLDGDLVTAVEPLVREESVLRASLRPGLLRAVAFNTSRQIPEVSLFEIGQVFRAPPGRPGPRPEEHEVLAVALAGGAGAVEARQVLDVVLAGVERAGARLVAGAAPGLHPTRTAEVRVGDDLLGHVGELDPDVVEAHGLAGRVGWIELDLAGLLPTTRGYARARALSRHPATDFDLAFVVADAAPADAVAATLRASVADLLVDLRLFDVFRDGRLGPDRRSLAFRLRLQALDRTLTDAEVADIRARAVAAVAAEHGGELRG